MRRASHAVTEAFTSNAAILLGARSESWWLCKPLPRPSLYLTESKISVEIRAQSANRGRRAHQGVAEFSLRNTTLSDMRVRGVCKQQKALPGEGRLSKSCRLCLVFFRKFASDLGNDLGLEAIEYTLNGGSDAIVFKGVVTASDATTSGSAALTKPLNVAAAAAARASE